MKKRWGIIISAAVVCLLALAVGMYASAADTYDGLPFDEELFYGRSALAEMDNGKALVAAYDKIYAAVAESKPAANFLPDVTDAKITPAELENIVLNAYRFDNPQHFWLNWFSGYGYDGNGYVTSVSIVYFDDLNTPEAKSQFEAAARQFITDAGVVEGMTQYEIALALYEKIVGHVTYVGSANSHNAYGALIEGEAVCEGYAELYQYLLYLNGIQSHEITGNANGAHAWNLVRLDGKYYMADPTWDDQLDGNGVQLYPHRYFNVTTDFLLTDPFGNRVIDNNGYPLPVCTATAANYYNHPNYNFSLFKTQPSYASAVKQLMHYGKARFRYIGDGEYTFNDFNAWVNANISNILYGGELQFSGEVGAYCGYDGTEFVLTVNGIVKQPLPVVANVPKLAAACFGTAVTILPDVGGAGVAVCPMPTGKTLTESEIQGLTNNTALALEGLENGKVTDQSRLTIDGESAKVAVRGDVDGDGEITVFDAVMARDVYNGETAPAGVESYTADADGNGLDSSDSQTIVDHVVK